MKIPDLDYQGEMENRKKSSIKGGQWWLRASASAVSSGNIKAIAIVTTGAGSFSLKLRR